MQALSAVQPIFSASAIQEHRSLDVALRSAAQNLTDEMLSARHRIDQFMQSPGAYANPATLAAFQVELANYSVNNAVISGVVKRLATGVETLVKG
ncbi:hypothetical protein [Robbsia andropogonis]|uniref:hypothetical protein n=1 Tax=Robbsia andropogonis TaxID=28092 RepID=UPI000464D9CF|nr:hypothetical protein [Robbsia andropogonis]